MHGMHKADVVNALCGMWEYVAYPFAALPVLLEAVRGGH